MIHHVTGVQRVRSSVVPATLPSGTAGLRPHPEPAATYRRNDQCHRVPLDLEKFWTQQDLLEFWTQQDLLETRRVGDPGMWFTIT